MSSTTLHKETEKVDGHLNDEFVLSEINRIPGLSTDESVKPHERHRRAARILEISCIVFLYAVSIAAILEGVLHELGGGSGGNLTFP
jgi:hypothetical protein